MAGQLLERLTADSSSSTQQSEVPCSRQGLETRYRPGAQSAAEDRRRACRLLWAPERGREEDPALLADPSPARDPAQVWTQASRLPGLYAWHQREQGMKGMGEGDGPLPSTQRLAGSLTRLTACPLLAVPHLVFQSCASPSQEARPLLKGNDLTSPASCTRQSRPAPVGTPAPCSRRVLHAPTSYPCRSSSSSPSWSWMTTM